MVQCSCIGVVFFLLINYKKKKRFKVGGGKERVLKREKKEKKGEKGGEGSVG